MAFKFDGQKIPFGPEPKPLREIWVYHPDLEGVHLRGGKVARGGLRFSDRPDDFRTEIHGLMATQMVKNVLIVPVGAKGGFVLRQPPIDRNELRAAGDRYYETFIEAIGSLTDNVVDGKVVTPEGILHTEGPDPYLVVAADKGTAHLSDTANAVSMRHQFWLDDAFASGGSNGFDHKETGITARGAWETTKRCFRELGIDPETDTITAVGVGDMSGDVFGNGLLRSRTVKLLAAFNHAHVFVDPDPNAELAYVERERLFTLPRSQWTDYKARGAVEGRRGVHAQRQVAGPVARGPDPARVRAGADGQRRGRDPGDPGAEGRPVLDGRHRHLREEQGRDQRGRRRQGQRRGPHQLDPAALPGAQRGRQPVDHGSRARGLRAAGGQNYTSFLDNSGGVDTSDHEVNIKILFAPLLASGAVTRERRNELLRAAEADVCEAVLANNRSQSRMVSFDVRRSRKDVYRYSRTLSYLVHKVPFNPDTFGLPTEDELAIRSRKGGGLFKCDASALCAYSKMLVYRTLLEEKPLSEGLVDRMAREYFPAVIVEAAGEAVHNHLLRREIATTMVVNRIIDNAGATFFPELLASARRSASEIAEAYMSAAQAGDIESIRRDLYACEDKSRQESVYRAMTLIEGALEEATYDLLDRKTALPFDQKTVERARELLGRIHEALRPSQITQLAAQGLEFEAGGFPKPLAARVAGLMYFTDVLESLRMAHETGREPLDLLRMRLQISAEMHIPALQEALGRMVFTSPWDGPAAKALSRQLDVHLSKMVRLVEGDDVGGVMERFGLDFVRQQAAANLESGVTIPGIVMLDQHLRGLLLAT
jgi:glutamate dehydrogenase